MTPPRRAVVVIVAAGVLGTSLVAASAQASPAGPDQASQASVIQPAPVLRPSTSAPEATVRVKGRLGTHLVRKVVLQRKAGLTWLRVSGAKTDPTGRYRIHNLNEMMITPGVPLGQLGLEMRDERVFQLYSLDPRHPLTERKAEGVADALKRQDMFDEIAVEPRWPEDVEEAEPGA